MKLKLKIWRQKNSDSKGKIVDYDIDNISPDMSFLEMLDVLNSDLISKNNIDPESIDMVIVATITPDMYVAATAAYVASSIGAFNAFSYDLSAACSGFLYGMSTSAAYIASGKYKKVLLIGADKMSSIVDYTDRDTCLIFGYGAGAVLF